MAGGGCGGADQRSYLIPVLEAMLAQFPFRIRGFHSDNGSEFINHTVAKLLNKLLIEQTKSRPRHSNDNGLAEAKNGAVVRKHMGYDHIAGAACGSDRRLLPGAFQSVSELSPAVRCAGGDGQREREDETNVPVVRDAVGDPASIAGAGRAPSAGLNDCRIRAAGGRENGQCGGRADAGREAETFRRLSNPEERVRQQRKHLITAQKTRGKVRGALPGPPPGGHPLKPPGAVEMPGGGRRWKTLVSRYGKIAARRRVSHRRPPPLEIAEGAISTFPQRRRVSLSREKHAAPLGRIRMWQCPNSERRPGFAGQFAPGSRLILQ